MPIRVLQLWKTCAAALILLAGLPGAQADKLDEAAYLLRISKAGDHFEARAHSQAQRLIYQYFVIVRRNTDYRLPANLQQRIAECYASEYRWENFAPGIARILAENLSEQELQLLIDFHSNLGMPPSAIELFKSTVAKAGLISEQSASYIFSTSPGCLERDVQLILEHLQANAVTLAPQP